MTRQPNAHVNARPTPPAKECQHPTVSDQLRCIDCGATIERLDRVTAIAECRKATASARKKAPK